MENPELRKKVAPLLWTGLYKCTAGMMAGKRPFTGGKRTRGTAFWALWAVEEVPIRQGPSHTHLPRCPAFWALWAVEEVPIRQGPSHTHLPRCPVASCASPSPALREN